jgi:hypothetical protein
MNDIAQAGVILIRNLFSASRIKWAFPFTTSDSAFDILPDQILACRPFILVHSVLTL